MRRLLISSLMSAMVLSGCAGGIYNLPGARPIIKEKSQVGVGKTCTVENHADTSAKLVKSISKKNRNGTSRTFGMLDFGERFYAFACDSYFNPNVSGKAQMMLRSGFTLVQARCNDFFWRMGDYQTGIQTSKGLIAPLVTILTGIISLKNFNSTKKQDRFIDIIGLASTAAITGLELYEEQFLFGAENIDAVRSMVNTELSVSRRDIDALNLTNFDEVALQLIEHQMICTPRHIMLQARASIKNADIQPVNVTNPIVRAEETNIYQKLAGIFEIETTLSSSEAGALWWLVFTLPPQYEGDDGTTEDRQVALAAIHDLLQGFNDTQIPVKKNDDAFELNDSFTNERSKALAELLQQLPSSRQATFRYETVQKNRDIAAKREAKEKADEVAAEKARVEAEEAAEKGEPPPVPPVSAQESSVAEQGKEISNSISLEGDSNSEDKLVTPTYSPQ